MFTLSLYSMLPLFNYHLCFYPLFGDLGLCKFNKMNDRSFCRTDITATAAFLTFHNVIFDRQIELLCLAHNTQFTGIQTVRAGINTATTPDASVGLSTPLHRTS